MSHYGKRPRLSLEEDFQDTTETQEFVCEHIPTDEEEEIVAEEEEEEREEMEEVEDEEEKSMEEEMEKCRDEVDWATNEGEENEDEEYDNISSISFGSFNVSLPSSSPPSPFVYSSSSSSTLFQDTPESDEENASMMLSIPQNAQSCFLFSSLWRNFDMQSSHQEAGDSDNIQSSTDPESLLQIMIKEKATDLVFRCLFKYRVKEPITEEEILEVVTKEYEYHFPVILFEASKYLEMTFGLDIKENDLINSSYVLVNSLNLTYEDVQNDQKMPRNAFLILILGVIFIEGNCASEERMWEFLNMIEIYDGESHIIYGEPRKFLTIDLVEQNYLQYQQVPNSHPPRFQFLWGPRAHAETTKMKVLEFLAKINSCDPTSFPLLYEEALRDEEVRSWVSNCAINKSPRVFSTER